MRYGAITLYGDVFQTHLDPTLMLENNTSIDYNAQMCKTQLDLNFELFPLHSPLLGESLLFSFPPLIDMLKFSG